MNEENRQALEIISMDNVKEHLLRKFDAAVIFNHIHELPGKGRPKFNSVKNLLYEPFFVKKEC